MFQLGLGLAIGRQGGATGLRGDVYGSFATMSNGAPTTAVTGQPFIRYPAETGVVLATVSSGILVAADGGQASTAAYTGLRLPEDIKSEYADVSFGDANDALGLLATSDVSITAIGVSSVHVIFTYNSWTLQYYTAGSPITVNSASFSGPAFGARVRVGWRIVGSDVYVLQANGTEVGPFTSSALTTRANHVAIYEHFRNATGTPGLKIYAIAANLFATPVAAGRTNLLLAQNDTGNAAWTKTSISGPTTGQSDAAGGTLGEKWLEAAVTDVHWFYQPIVKAAAPVRYTLRYKVKLIGRDWVNITAIDGAFSGQANRFLNVTTGALGTQAGSFTDQFWMIYPLSGGFYQVQADFLSNSDAALYSFLQLASADTVSSYAGDIAKGMTVYDQWLFSRPT